MPTRQHGIPCSSRILVTLRASSVPRPPFDASCSAETRATGGGGGGGGLSLEDVVAMKSNGRNSDQQLERVTWNIDIVEAGDYPRSCGHGSGQKWGNTNK